MTNIPLPIHHTCIWSKHTYSTYPRLYSIYSTYTCLSSIYAWDQHTLTYSAYLYAAYIFRHTQ